MAFTIVTMYDGQSHKEVPLGFSWTTFFFGPIPAAIRKDWCVALVLLVFCVLSYGTAGWLAAFFYNKMYVNQLMREGYKLNDIPAHTSVDRVNDYLGIEPRHLTF